MTEAEILDRIATVAREKLDLEIELKQDMRLVEDLALDSIRLLTLAMEVEDRFRICLDEEDEEGIETVADLVELVGRKLAAA
ncbi:MAG: phosphopantetheine-binding protein [Acidobacteriota bacterium]